MPRSTHHEHEERGRGGGRRTGQAVPQPGRRGRGRARGRPRGRRPARSSGSSGPNGAGKSTTVRMLTTLMTITSGSARVAGVDVARRPDAVRRRIGVALQEAGLDPRQTGRELLVLQARLFGLAPADAAGRAEELLELVELDDAADRRIKGYSGGMKRRLDLASALVHRPDVLFLDEPTTGLDPASRLTVWDEVRRINEQGTTVFLTTQYLEEADQLCDRLAIIDDGRIVREGTPGAAEGRAARAAGPDRGPDARRRVPRRDRPHPQPRRRRRAGGAGMTPDLGTRAARDARGVADARRAAPDVVHPAVLPGRQRRPGGEDLPVGVDRRSSKGRATPRSSCRARCCSRASFGTAALFLVEDIEGGYFDKLRAAPVPRTAIVIGRLIAEGVKGAADRHRARAARAAVRHHDRQRAARLRAADRADLAVGGRLRRVHAAHRAEDAQRRRHELGQPRSSSRCCS